MQTERDKQIVDWIGRLGAAGAQHVMRRFAMGRTTTYARLNGLVTDGLLVHRTILYGEPGLYLASADGLRWCGLERLGVYRVSVADIAGTRATWVTTHQTSQGLLGTGLSGTGSMSRGYEYELHPGQIKRLPTGGAAVVTPGRPQTPTIARIRHPRDAAH